jgi:phage-related tail fiber protein
MSISNVFNLALRKASALVFDDSTAQTGSSEIQGAIEALKILADIGVDLESNSVAKVDWFARNTAPTGWLKANGAAVSRTTYERLFNVIGTTYGVGDGSTTFNLPDLRGEFLRGWDDGRGVDAGRGLGTAQADAFGSHGHGMPSSIVRGTGGGTFSGNAGTNFVVEGALSTTAAGGSETRPRNVALLACIKF